jgi:hypothetical protein
MAKERASNNLLELIGRGVRPAAPKTATLASMAIPAAKPSSESAKKETEVAVVEKTDGLLEQVLANRGHVEPEEAKGELATLHGILQGLSQKTVVVVFALGKILSEVKAELPHGEFLPWIEDNCPFPRSSASNYMRVYDRYKDEPRRALAELSITDAYIEAGVKKLSAPEKDEDGANIRGIVGLDGEPGFDEFRSAFKQPTLSGVTLKHYRIAPYRNGTLYMVRPETGALPVCNLFVNMSIEDPAYQAAIAKAHQDVQLALEVFFSKVEELEDRGVLPAPFNTSRKAMISRMRDVTPDTSVPKKKPAAKKTAKGKKK